jgi:hypothetical protein
MINNAPLDDPGDWPPEAGWGDVVHALDRVESAIRHQTEQLDDRLLEIMREQNLLFNLIENHVFARWEELGRELLWEARVAVMLLVVIAGLLWK